MKLTNTIDSCQAVPVSIKTLTRRFITWLCDERTTSQQLATRILQTPDSKTYLEMPQLSQQSIEARRGYEWKVNFSLWGGLALVAYFCWKERIADIFISEGQARVLAIIL